MGASVSFMTQSCLCVLVISRKKQDLIYRYTNPFFYVDLLEIGQVDIVAFYWFSKAIYILLYFIRVIWCISNLLYLREVLHTLYFDFDKQGSTYTCFSVITKPAVSLSLINLLTRCLRSQKCSIITKSTSSSWISDKHKNYRQSWVWAPQTHITHSIFGKW